MPAKYWMSPFSHPLYLPCSPWQISCCPLFDLFNLFISTYYLTYKFRSNSCMISKLFWNLVSLSREHLASRVVLISKPFILIFLDLLSQTSSNHAAVKNTMDCS